jgi:hypothetical protein
MKNIFVCGIALCSLYACTEAELRKSIFIPDPQAPELPKYSEWGYNTFGGYYDRETFVSNDIEVPVKILQEAKRTSFVFTGQKGTGLYTDRTYSAPYPFAITLIVPDSSKEYADLVKFHNVTFNLEDPATEILVRDNARTDTAKVLSGEFRFVRAQYLLVDGKAEQVILSGTFDFQAIINGNPVTISDGRFDVGIGDYNFFKF